MVDSSLVEYINSSRRSGQTDEQIRNTLLRTGWNAAQVDAALRAGVPSPFDAAKKAEPVVKLHPSQRITMILGHPAKYFERIREEKDFVTPLLFYFVIAVIANLAQTFMQFGTADLGGLGIVFGLVLLVLSFLLIPIGLFISAGITHLGVLIFGGRAGFIQTFKAVSYGLVVGFFYGILNAILAVVISVEAPTGKYGLPFDFSTAFSPNLMIIFAISLISFVHVLALQTVGVAAGHRISGIRAFFGVIFFPGIILIFVLLIVIGGMAYFGALDPGSFLPERCMGPAGLDCIDNAAISSDGSVEFSLRNNIGFPIEVGMEIEGSDMCKQAALVSVNGKSEFPVTLEQSEASLFVVDCGEISETRFKGDFEIPYLNTETGISHKGFVSISGSVN